MKRFIFPVATLWLAVVFSFGGNVIADTGELDAAEAESLSLLREFAVYMEDIYGSSAHFCPYVSDDCAFFAVIGAGRKAHSDALQQLLYEYGGPDPVVDGQFSDDFLTEDLGIRMYTGWINSYSGLVNNAAYLEEMNIRDLRLALDGTDEEPLLNAYTRMLHDDYLHLLTLASALRADPFDYSAQLLGDDEVQQILFEAMDLASQFEFNAGLSDAWYDPATDGQGFTINVFEDSGTVFLAWFTYDTALPGAGATADLGDAGQRWLTAQGEFQGTQAELVVYSSSGGVFDASPPAPEQVPVGSILLRFQDCHTGVVEYDLPGIGRSGSIPIVRVASDNAALCEAFTTAAPPSTVVSGETAETPPATCYAPEGSPPQTLNQLFAVWGSSSKDVFAVGGAGTILHYDGSHWTPMAWGEGFGFEGVWGSSGTDVYAVGGYDGFGLALGVVFHYDGDCWRQVFSTTDFQFTDVWGSGAGDVFATTSRGGILHYDGTAWTSMNVNAGEFNSLGGVWGTGAGNVYAVGENTIWHYDGSAWRLTATVDSRSLRRVWGSGASDVFAVGANYTPTTTEAAVWHYDGAGWTFMPVDKEGMRWSVWGTGPNNVFAVGDEWDRGLISHYDGTGWRTTLVTVTPTLQGVWGSAANDVYAVGGGARNGFCCTGAGTILHFDGHSWQSVMEYGRFK